MSLKICQYHNNHMMLSYKKQLIKPRLACLKHLDISRSTSIKTQFPIDICVIESLTSLKILTPNNITITIPIETRHKIPEDIQKLKNLTELTIDNQNLSHSARIPFNWSWTLNIGQIPLHYSTTFTLQNLSKITTLNFTKVKIDNDDFKCLNKLYELKSLSFQDCFIEDFTTNIAHPIQYLEHFSLKNFNCDFHSNQNFLKFQNALSKATKLKSLTLSKCDLHIIPTSIKQIQSLEYLDLSNNELFDDEELHEILTKLINLTHLNLYDSDSKFSLLPISRMTKLTHLDIGFCQITDSEQIYNMTNLIELKCEGTKIGNLSPRISQLKNLKLLDIRKSCFVFEQGTSIEIMNTSEFADLTLFTEDILNPDDDFYKIEHHIKNHIHIRWNSIYISDEIAYISNRITMDVKG